MRQGHGHHVPLNNDVKIVSKFYIFARKKAAPRLNQKFFAIIAPFNPEAGRNNSNFNFGILKKHLTSNSMKGLLIICLILWHSIHDVPAAELVKSVSVQVLHQNLEGGNGQTWFHPKACVIPGKDGGPHIALMTKQIIGGSDYFGPVHWSTSLDQGKTWSEPTLIPAFDRKPVVGHEGLMAGVCDVVPEYHAATDTVLALGHVVFYRGPRFSGNDQLARYPVYSVRRSDGTWSERRILEWKDPRGAFIYSNNCGQRWTLPNGDILLAFTFGPKSNHSSVAGVICSFDGEFLKIKQVGPPLKLEHKRGLLEPSITRFKSKFYMTIRAEDDRGYLSTSEDGIHWHEKTPWSWDDGEPLSMSSTQQHWMTHSEGLYLVYTRKDAKNSDVIRWRSPLYMARFDPEKNQLVGSSERIVIPMNEDGISHPDRVALMGNFHITHASANESWITVGDWLPRQGASGTMHLARIQWTQPNQFLKMSGMSDSD